jgi:putative aldouronate transport system permease protein
MSTVSGARLTPGRSTRRAGRIRRRAVARVFDAANYTLLLLLAVATLYPFLNILSLSLTSESVVSSGMANLNLIPEKLSIKAYGKVLSSEYILAGFENTLLRTVLGTVATVAVTLFLAYPLSKRYFPHRTFWTMLIVFTMFFQGGLIPVYLLVRKLGLINNVLSLILPDLVRTFSLIVVRNYLMTIPEDLEESARLDGAGDLRILFAIVIPVSVPIIATLTLWTVVGHWNAWFDSLIYTTRTKLLVLQVVLRRIVLEGTQQIVSTDIARDDRYATKPEVVRAASIVVTTLPIVMVYPFVQKYFIKGIMIGSLKG